MRNFVIVTDSCSDISRAVMEKYSIDCLPQFFAYEDKSVETDTTWSKYTPREFYDIMRGGARVTTSQVTGATFTEYFEKQIAEGNDVLYVACSSALSASVEASTVARDEVLARHPEARIVCIDTLTACAGLAMLCEMAGKLRAEGKSLDEVAEWISANARCIHQEGTVDKLVYLKRAGRVSAASAFFGGLLNIKPIIIRDACGRNAAVEKVKGRMTSFKRLIERFLEGYVPSDMPITIAHADCIEDAEELKGMLAAALDENDKTEIRIDYVGPMVGASVGPGMIGIYFYGKEVTYNAEENK
ncbi:MAG: DegV family protein [Clostridia bacterium]|nr:DegV family protein [Clostridia bacterium]MBQ8371720.1 DegV family protein [Clostridia bacterium]